MKQERRKENRTGSLSLTSGDCWEGEGVSYMNIARIAREGDLMSSKSIRLNYPPYLTSCPLLCLLRTLGTYLGTLFKYSI